ncbi:hypothetical protein AAIR98_000973 [Elusimicrobium simillimum]|uniref:hypothetical protein n=1 Tax=Elusimicrobium simillimum TaxID=3143438 RepID=UPI003C6FE4C4
MFKKILALSAVVLLLNACATFGAKKDYSQMAAGRGTPSYFSNGETAVAFKTTSVIRDINLEGVLIIKSLDGGDYSVKIMGPMGTKIVDAALINGKVSYDYVLPDINTGVIKSRFEKCIFALLVPPGKVKKAKFKKDGTLELRKEHVNGTTTYVYTDGASFPGSATSGSITIAYSNYEPYATQQLPYSIYYKDSFAEVDLNLELISIR